MFRVNHIAGIEAILGVLPLSVGSALGLLINTLVVFVVLIIVNKLIEHDMEPKQSFIMAFLAMFITPIVMLAIGLSGVASVIPFFGVIVLLLIPLIVWIVLGEVLLKGDMKEKLKVIVVAFLVYTILNFIGVPYIISGAIPF
ncbi:MAG: hypothetical protein ABIA21_03420 [Candidatus Aenigmatarchaeota archaeon]